MLTQEQVTAKLEELQKRKKLGVQQARDMEDQQQLLARQQNALVMGLQNIQGQIEALNEVLAGEPEKKEEGDATEKGNEQGDSGSEHSA